MPESMFDLYLRRTLSLGIGIRSCFVFYPFLSPKELYRMFSGLNALWYREVRRSNQLRSIICTVLVL